MVNRFDFQFYFLTKWTLLSIVIIGFNFFFWFRYTSFLIPQSNVLKSLAVIDISFLTAIISITVLKRLINPISLYSLFIFFTGFSYLTISNNQSSSYRPITELVLLLTIVSFLLGCLINQKAVRIKFIPLDRNAVRLLFLIIIICSIIVFALEVAAIGYIPIFSLSADLDVYSETNEVLIPFAHYLVLFMGLIPAISYAFYKEGKINRIVFITFSAVSFFIILNFLSRQNIMLLMLSLFYAYTYYNKISTMKILLIGVVILAMFVVIGNLRAGSSELVGGVNEYLKGYAQIDKDVSLFETYLTLYSSQNFTTLDKLVSEIAHNNQLGFGTYSLRPVISLFMFDRIGIVDYNPDYDGFKSLATYAFDPFIDFNLLGVIFINCLYGFLCMNTYRNFTQKLNTQSIINWSLLSFCIIMSSFTSFYNTFFIWFAILLSIPLTNHKFKTK